MAAFISVRLSAATKYLQRKNKIVKAAGSVLFQERKIGLHIINFDFKDASKRPGVFLSAASMVFTSANNGAMFSS